MLLINGFVNEDMVFYLSRVRQNDRDPEQWAQDCDPLAPICLSLHGQSILGREMKRK